MNFKFAAHKPKHTNLKDMKRIYLLLTIASFCLLPANADNNGNAGECAFATSTVATLRSQLPLNTSTSGTLIKIESPSSPLTVTTDMGEVSAENFQAFAKNSDLIKNMAIQDYQGLGEPLISIARAALNAGIPFAIHFEASGFPEGFTIVFSPEELEKMLIVKQSTNHN